MKKSLEEIESEIKDLQSQQNSARKWEWVPYVVLTVAALGAASMLYLSIFRAWPWE